MTRGLAPRPSQLNREAKTAIRRCLSPSGSGGQTTNFRTDRNQFSTLTAPGSKTWTFNYNELGQPTDYDIPNGMACDYGYDARNRLTAIEYKDGTTVLDGFYYDLADFGY